ncbi:hypothetical protein [Pseudomonas sp. CC120222-01a]|uniref:hypothetical protein n=1 Tax=Pseudomonas sp. CC120222-01a TaxID=1378075 RepID=UPI000D94CEF6|nr:hypothetical protein [Pseudomonas sp. CC120222-01a]PVZ43155.1 hypothetical protein N430_00843 [Pseudomonas sp. CC120222-01a]
MKHLKSNDRTWQVERQEQANRQVTLPAPVLRNPIDMTIELTIDDAVRRSSVGQCHLDGKTYLAFFFYPGDEFKPEIEVEAIVFIHDQAPNTGEFDITDTFASGSYSALFGLGRIVSGQAIIRGDSWGSGTMVIKRVTSTHPGITTLDATAKFEFTDHKGITFKIDVTKLVASDPNIGVPR